MARKPRGFRMKLRTSDMERISSRICQKKGCKNKSYALFHAKFLCKEHYREKKPNKESHFRYGRKVRLSAEYWKESFYMP